MENIKNFNIDSFRKRLTAEYRKHNMTQDSLSQISDVNKSNISYWYRNFDTIDVSGKIKKKSPSLSDVYKISQALNVSIDYLANPDISCKTITKQQISEYIGLSDDAIECLHSWKCEKEKNKASQIGYSNDLDTLDTILRYYESERKKNYKKRQLNHYSLFHYIGNFINAKNFQRIQQDVIRYKSGTRYKELKKGDNVNGETIESVCVPINRQTHKGNDVTKLDIINANNTNELYEIEISDLYREYSKDQIIEQIKSIAKSLKA